jgi:multidrug resistance efflux pump
MTWLRRVRPLLYLLGVLLVVGSLLGARLLSHGSGGGSEAPPKTAIPPTNGKNGIGLVVIGYADSDSPVVGFGLPPVLQSGTIAQVFVKQFQEVKKGDPLYAFDASVQAGDVKKAEAAVHLAEKEVDAAKAAVDQHQVQIDLQQEAIRNAEEEVRQTKESYTVTRYNYAKSFRESNPGATEAKIEEQVANNVDVLRTKLAYETAVRKHGFEITKLEGLKKTGVNYLVDKANAGLEQAKTALAQAKVVFDLCTVRARSDGVIERINSGVGQVVGVSTREPVVVLIPAGSLVVRADVEAEFIHRIGPDKEGKQVTISDHYDNKLTYKGVVRKIGNAFLQKRTAGDGFGMNDTRVLEVVVEVTDPNPPGKPSLKVGQKVRVNFGQ